MHILYWFIPLFACLPALVKYLLPFPSVIPTVVKYFLPFSIWDSCLWEIFTSLSNVRFQSLSNIYFHFRSGVSTFVTYMYMYCIDFPFPSGIPALGNIYFPFLGEIALAFVKYLLSFPIWDSYLEKYLLPFFHLGFLPFEIFTSLSHLGFQPLWNVYCSFLYRISAFVKYLLPFIPSGIPASMKNMYFPFVVYRKIYYMLLKIFRVVYMYFTSLFYVGFAFVKDLIPFLMCFLFYKILNFSFPVWDSCLCVIFPFPMFNSCLFEIFTSLFFMRLLPFLKSYLPFLCGFLPFWNVYFPFFVVLHFL